MRCPTRSGSTRTTSSQPCATPVSRSKRWTAPSLNAGMDYEMPEGKGLNEDNAKPALRDPSLEIKGVARPLTRRFPKLSGFGQFDRPYAPGEIAGAGHGAAARRIGTEIAVL